MTTSKYLTINNLPTRTIKRLFNKIKIDPIDPMGKYWIWTGPTNGKSE